MDFIVGYDLKRFEEYYRTLHDLHEYYSSIGTREATFHELGTDELNHIERDPKHLILWKDSDTIIGHTIWHETTTDEMIPGDPRDDEDKSALYSLFEGARDNLVELHELWLRTEYRGKGYGEQFFDFFEKFALKEGFEGVVYYSENPSAISICRRRGYKEAQVSLEGKSWYVFTKVL